MHEYVRQHTALLMNRLSVAVNRAADPGDTAPEFEVAGRQPVAPGAGEMSRPSANGRLPGIFTVSDSLREMSGSWYVGSTRG